MAGIVGKFDLSDTGTVKRLALCWRSSLAGSGLDVEDIEQEIVLAQLEFEAGLRKRNPGEHVGALFCQLAGDRQISVGAARSQTDKDDTFDVTIIGAGIEHIDPARLLEISQDITDCEPVAQIHDIAASDLAAVLGVTVRQARNVRKTLSEV